MYSTMNDTNRLIERDASTPGYSEQVIERTIRLLRAERMVSTRYLLHVVGVIALGHVRGYRRKPGGPQRWAAC